MRPGSGRSSRCRHSALRTRSCSLSSGAPNRLKAKKPVETSRRKSRVAVRARDSAPTLVAKRRTVYESETRARGPPSPSLARQRGARDDDRVRASPRSRVVVVGQGYVGLPLAMRAVSVGYDVIGFDLDEERAKRLNAGESSVEDVPV